MKIARLLFILFACLGAVAPFKAVLADQAGDRGMDAFFDLVAADYQYH